jgi:hypothetical protein
VEIVHEYEQLVEKAEKRRGEEGDRDEIAG